MVGKRSHIGR